MLVVERWILARLRNRRFFSLEELNRAIAELIKQGYVRHIGLSEVGPKTIRRAQASGSSTSAS